MKIEVRQCLDDPVWDNFLRSTPGGDHVQASSWARVKAERGWHCMRLIAFDSGSICAGMQILYRTLPVVGSIGYVQKGPVVSVRLAGEAHAVLDAIRMEMRHTGIGLIFLQPPRHGQWLDAALRRIGFRISRFRIGLPETTIVDLRLEPEALLAAMRPMTRRNVRLAMKRDIVVRHGDKDDLAVFCRLLQATAVRQSFVADTQSHFRDMWRIMGPAGQVKLLVAEYEGEPVSAAWLVPFADTVIYKRGAWAGNHGSRRPNELLHWTAMNWAREAGFSYYDFDGIDRPSTGARSGRRAISSTTSVAMFKLGFGGQVEALPETYEYAEGRLSRFARFAIATLQDWHTFKRVMK